MAFTLAGCAGRPHTIKDQNACSYPSQTMIIRSSDIEPSVPTTIKTVTHKYSKSVVRHTVKRGETLWSISKLYGVDVGVLAQVNSLSSSVSIEVGQVLLIPEVTARSSRKIVNYTPRRSTTFIWPVKGAIAAYFGSKIDKSVNKGIDIRAGMGTNVLASRSGKVVYCDTRLKGFGHTVIIDHMDGFQTVYSYNSFIAVKVGDLVEQNDVIAKVGSSGRASGNMLHFEIRRNGEPQNPEFYLTGAR